MSLYMYAITNSNLNLPVSSGGDLSMGETGIDSAQAFLKFNVCGLVKTPIDFNITRVLSFEFNGKIYWYNIQSHAAQGRVQKGLTDFWNGGCHHFKFFNLISRYIMPMQQKAKTAGTDMNKLNKSTVTIMLSGSAASGYLMHDWCQNHGRSHKKTLVTCADAWNPTPTFHSQTEPLYYTCLLLMFSCLDLYLISRHKRLNPGVCCTGIKGEGEVTGNIVCKQLCTKEEESMRRSMPSCGLLWGLMPGHKVKLNVCCHHRQAGALSRLLF